MSDTSISKIMKPQITFLNASKQTDSILDVEYTSAITNARSLSSYLKNNLKNRHIDYNIFNSDRLTEENEYNYKKEQKNTVDNPPREIYEYQNFFLLDRDGEYILMDGFRRLLWYNVPDINVNVRIYDAGSLSDKNMLSLMVNLNHFKFFSGSHYHDRGFGLFLKMVFDLNISKYVEALDGYLSSSKTRRDWLISGDKSTRNDWNISVKDRIVNDHFVDDMRFIELLNNAGAMMNRYVGSLVYSKRASTDMVFKADDFLSVCAKNSPLQALIAKYNVVGFQRGAESEKITNQILEIYDNVIAVMMGGKVKKSYAERLADCKALVEQMKKDKNLIKLTGSNFSDELERLLARKIEAGEKINFKCVIYPIKDEEEHIFESGVNTNVRFIQWAVVKHRFSDDIKYRYPIFGIYDGKKLLFKIGHNYGMSNYTSYITKRWATLRQYKDKDKNIELYGGERYDIDLFVEMPQNVLKEIKNGAK